MPPRKIVRSSKKSEEKSPRGRPKKEKPVLKTPTLLTLKIPKQILPKTATETLNIDNVVKGNEDGCQQKSTKTKVNENIPVLEVEKGKKTVTKRKQVLQRKRVLKKNNLDDTTGSANVVELAKKRRTKATKPDIDNVISKKGSIEENQNLFNIPELNKNYTKIVMANKVVSLQFQKKPLLTEELQKTNILQGKKIIARKKQTVKRKKKLNVERGEAAVTAGEPAKRKIIRRNNPRKCTDVINKVEVKPISTKHSKGNENINSDSTFRPVTRHRRLSLNRNISKAGPVLGKKLNNIVKENISITCLNNDITQSNLTMDTKEIIFDNSQIDDKRSVGSADNSWIKDISSSSATSLITVGQEDFILIDNKLPILQLTHIDREFIKNKKQIDIINNYHEDISPQNKVENCGTFKANNVIETNPPSTSIDNTKIKVNERLGSSNIISNGQINQYTNKYVDNGTDIPRIPINQNTSSTSNSTPRSNSNTDSSTTSLSQSTTIKGSANSKSNILQKTDKLNSDSDKVINVPGPSSACISTSNGNLEQTKTSSLSNDVTNTNIILPKIFSTMKNFSLNNIQFSKKTNKHLHTNTEADSRIKRLQDKIFAEPTCNFENNLTRLALRVKQVLLSYNKLKECDSEEIENNCNYINFQESSSNHTETFNDTENITMNDNRKINESPKQNTENLQEELQIPREKIVLTSTTGDKVNKDNVSFNKTNHTLVDHDDDDALSLFAESITALESCRKSSINNSGLQKPESEEYIPRPIFKKVIKPISYRPTKITNDIIVNKNQNQRKMSEEHNVSSTLVFDEAGNKNVESNLFYEDRVGNYLQNSNGQTGQISNTINANQMSTSPRLMASIYRKGKSYVFSGSCYYNLKSICKHPNCKYPHVYYNVNDIQNKLLQLNEGAFIQEYMSMRSWPKLRRLYGLCFVKECIRRNLTRILVEMAIDFLNNNNNSVEENTIKFEIIDHILMYLNEVDLSSCDDLLQYNIQPGEGVLLCDTFISIIAKSQNFSRFKPIFIKLSQFMHGIGRRFDVDIAESILERICILPYEEMLTRAFLLIARNTDINIFSNKHIGNLEGQLQMLNNELYQELKNLKEQALLCLPVLAHCYGQSSRLQNDNRMEINSVQDNYNTHSAYLPDVGTALSPRVRHVHVGENDQNKTNFEITFSRNIDNLNRKINNDDAITNSENKSSVGFKKWRRRSIFDNYHLQNQNRIPSQPHLRMPFKRPCTDQSFGGSPAKFHRNSGPSNY